MTIDVMYDVYLEVKRKGGKEGRELWRGVEGRL